MCWYTHINLAALARICVSLGGDGVDGGGPAMMTFKLAYLEIFNITATVCVCVRARARRHARAMHTAERVACVRVWSARAPL